MAVLPVLLALLSPVVVPPAEPREFRGAWVATVDNIDWPSKPGVSTSQAQAELRNLIANAAALHLNALIFQVRPMADALYCSPVEPWSEFLTGSQGKAPSPQWDPLQFAIDECHKRGIELHAWFNPYRAWHPAAKSSPSQNCVLRCHPDWVVRYGDFMWMDPGKEEVQDLTKEVVLDVVRRYDVDGVQIDDYFYPYPEGGQDFPDDATYQDYLMSGGTLTKADWRRKNVNDLVHSLYNGIKAEKKWVKFGISPFGIFRPGVPKGIQAGLDQYDQLYADARKWLVQGWCDYFSPQLYWPIEQKPQSYRVLLKWWASQNEKGIHLWPGLFTSQVSSGKKGWTKKEIPNQVTLTRRVTGATGHIHFSFKALRQDYKGVADLLRGSCYQSEALIPASPWLDNTPPDAPSQDGEALEHRVFEAAWQPEGKEQPASWAVWKRYGTQWMFQILPAAETRLSLPTVAGDKRLDYVSVAAVDRCGNVSTRLVLLNR